MHHATKSPPNKQLIYLAILIAFLIFIIGLQSCNSEKKALKPYKSVNSDVSTDFKEKKKELIARVCAVNFPIVPITIIKDSIRTKVIKVQDNTLVNKLKQQLAKGCPTLNIDSIYNEFPEDTIYIDHYHNTTTTVKDTTGNYFRQLNEDALRDTTNKYKAENSSLNKQIEDVTKDINDAKKEINKWKWRCILACMAFVSSWGLYGYFKLRKSLMPKI